MSQLPEQPGQPATPSAHVTESDPLSAMTPRFNWPFRWFARRFFRHFGLDDKTVRRLQEYVVVGDSKGCHSLAFRPPGRSKKVVVGAADRLHCELHAAHCGRHTRGLRRPTSDL